MNYVIFPLSPHSPSPPPGQGGAVPDHHTLVNELHSLSFCGHQGLHFYPGRLAISAMSQNRWLSETLFPYSPSIPRTIHMIYSRFVKIDFSLLHLQYALLDSYSLSSSSSSSLCGSRDLRPRPGRLAAPTASHIAPHSLQDFVPVLSGFTNSSRSLPSFYPSFFEIKTPPPPVGSMLGKRTVTLW